LAKSNNMSDAVDLLEHQTAPEAVGGGKRFNAILDAAEVVFASSGFNGASIREIANKAGVAQALIHYHFDNKEKLFESTTARRSTQINTARAKLLDRILASKDTPTLEMLVESLFRPTIETGHRLAGNGSSFSRILVSIANSHEKRDQRLIARYYDPTAIRFIKAFREIEPNLSSKSATWAYMFSIGVGLTMMAQTGRSLTLSNGVCDDSDIEAMLSEIVTYVCGGIRALVAQKRATKID
jgi:AcrR family transcriptional regulator